MTHADTIFCSDATPTIMGVFDLGIAPALLFYSYIPIIFIGIVLSFFILVKSDFSQTSKALLLIIISFSLFLINEIILWIALPVGIVAFSWTLALLLRLCILLSVLYFTYLFVKKIDVPYFYKILFFILSLPILLLSSTDLNIKGFDPDWCGGINGPLWNYLYVLEAFSIMTLSFWSVLKIREYFISKDGKSLSYIFIIISSTLFLIIFVSSQIFGEYLGLYEINLVGPVGMLIFMVVLTFTIVKYHAFNIKLAAPVSLVFAMWMLVFSLLFVHEIKNVTVIVGMTLILLTIVGFALIESVRNDIRSRMQIEKLVNDLAKANTRLKELDKQKSEFVSIASHQLRSPLTAISGYASLLQEGSYGKLPAKALEPIDRIYTSARTMTQSVEEYLNISRIESGNMKYDLVDFNLQTEVEHVCDDLRPIALKKGLLLFFRTDITSRTIVNADKGKVIQAIHNLINNSIKYTEKGTVTVLLRDDVNEKKIFIEVIDSGIGMSDETLSIIFNKFKRADNAHRVNIQGTGLGLYMALKIIEAMGGTINAYSEGEGKGSRFVIELPLIG